MSNLPNNGHAVLSTELAGVLQELGDEDFILINRHNGIFVEDANMKRIGVINMNTYPITFERYNNEDV
jgi:hypothetical protein